MMRGRIALIICIASYALNGCVPGRGFVTIHPLSEVTSPTFCLHTAVPHEPIPTKWLKVSTYAEERWKTLWELAYAPEGSDIPARPFSCITYGRPPPGYKEKAPAAALIADKWYSARLDDNADGAFPYAELHFIIRSDSSGRTTKLEYLYPGGYDKRVHVITKP